ncbi:MAG: methanethiol S-methyltransferase [Phycisphaerae bacterium]
MTSAAIPIEHVTSGRAQRRTVAGVATLAYGLLGYAAFVVTILYGIGFVGSWIVPKSINSGTPGALLPSLLINAALLAGFVLQHTIMARPAFKRWWTLVVPRPIERSTFVLFSSAALGLIFWQWRPLPDVVWRVDGAAAWFLNAVALAGWAIVFIASFTISHMDLFGVRQTWLRFRNQPYAPVGFRLRGLYRIVRHPLMVGFLLAFWATPNMTVGHLFFAIMTTGYILFGTWMEERDLVAEHGERYLDYRRKVRGLVPLPKRAAR